MKLDDLLTPPHSIVSTKQAGELGVQVAGYATLTQGDQLASVAPTFVFRLATEEEIEKAFEREGRFGRGLPFDKEVFVKKTAEAHKKAMDPKTGKGRDAPVLRPIGFNQSIGDNGGVVVEILCTEGPYSEAAGSGGVFGELEMSIGNKIRAMKGFPLGTPMNFSRNLGVTGALITSDGKLILDRRNDKRVFFDGGGLAPVAETALREHIADGETSVSAAEILMSGYEKEFGIPREAFLGDDGKPQILFSSYLTQAAKTSGGGPALVGVARTSWTAEQVVAAQKKAKEREGEPEVYDWNYETAVRLLEDASKVPQVRGKGEIRGMTCWCPGAIIAAIRTDRDMGPVKALKAAIKVKYEPTSDLVLGAVAQISRDIAEWKSVQAAQQGVEPGVDTSAADAFPGNLRDILMEIGPQRLFDAFKTHRDFARTFAGDALNITAPDKATDATMTSLLTSFADGDVPPPPGRGIPGD